MNTIEVDPRRCPLCGGPNDCGIAAGASTCWCFSTDVPAEVVARVPDEARDAMCVCRACAEGQSAAANQTVPADPSARVEQASGVDTPLLRPDVK